MPGPTRAQIEAKEAEYDAATDARVAQRDVVRGKRDSLVAKLAEVTALEAEIDTETAAYVQTIANQNRIEDELDAMQAEHEPDPAEPDLTGGTT